MSENKSSIFQERDILLNLSSCSIFLLCQATTQDESIIESLIESNDQMRVFYDLIETVLNSADNDQNGNSTDVQLIFSKNLILSILCFLCNVLSNSKGRSWFIKSCGNSSLIERLILMRQKSVVDSMEERILTNIFLNLTPCLEEINLDKSKIDYLKTFL
ncbi:unnamed protein product [Brachionus calyciflorus]|uniref:Uncharacterized protein n=1 Tax=Brachionus calyciflorus TaxID=104777 RepID=A0A813PW03_9BILA|nr:unnamed protein product [Brachionus calyciflorus]